MCRVFGITRATYGWMTRRLTMAECNKITREIRGAAKGLRCGSRYLKNVVEGGTTNLYAMIGQRQAMMLKRRLRRAQNQEGEEVRGKGELNTLMGQVSRWIGEN